MLFVCRARTLLEVVIERVELRILGCIEIATEIQKLNRGLSRKLNWSIEEAKHGNMAVASWLKNVSSKKDARCMNGK